MGASTRTVPQPIRQQIADRRAAGQSTAATAREFKVSEHLVRAVVRATAANGGTAPTPKDRGRPTDPAAVAEIARRWLAGETIRAIAIAVGKGEKRVYVVVKKLKADGTLPDTHPGRPDAPNGERSYRTKKPKGQAFREAAPALPPPTCFRCGKVKASVLGIYCRDCDRVYAKLRRRVTRGGNTTEYATAEARGRTFG